MGHTLLRQGRALAAKPCLLVVGVETTAGTALVQRLEASQNYGLIGTENQPNWADGRAVDRFLAKTRPHHVIVVAGPTAGIAGNQRSPASLMLANLLVVAHVIPAAWRCGAKKLLYLASSCVYPRDAAQPLGVDALWTGPLEPTSEAYATAKLAGVRLCAAYRQQHGARFISAVAADVFGPGDDFGSGTSSHVIGGLMARMHAAKLARAPRVTVWGTGTPQRDFIHVDDLADAMLFLMRVYEGERPINIGSGMTTSIRDLAVLLRDVVGFEGDLVFDAARPDGTPLKWLDSAPLRALGWAPSWDLRSALAHTYEWYVTRQEAVEA